MKCQLLWRCFGSGLWIMDFYWIIGLDISSSFQLSRQLHRGGLNIFLLGFELNTHFSCINLGSKKVLKTSFWNEFAVFQGQGSVSFSELGYYVGFPLVYWNHQESRECELQLWSNASVALLGLWSCPGTGSAMLSTLASDQRSRSWV